MESLKFDSVSELAQYVDNEQRNNGARLYGDHSTQVNNLSFYGDWTINQAIDCGLNGGDWKKGADAMPKLKIEHKTLNGGALPTPFIVTDLQGFAPNVPSYLSGQPDDMFDFIEQPSGNKLLKVAVHVGRYSECKQHTILRRGAAIMSVLSQLALEGYSIELWAIWRNTCDGSTASIETCIKHGVDLWSPESVAFALCHASFQRRLCWRAAESLTGEGGIVTNDSYGSGIKADFSDYDLSYGYVTGAVDDQMKTEFSTVEYIKNETIRQLESHEKAA